ncbi:MAG: cation transporter [Hyphomonadaceae bacterium]|nr:cation transporter [Hyphomonadaceae bacterium]
MDECCAHKSAETDRLALHSAQRRVLTIVLVLNASMFAAEFGAGIVAGSSALMADAVDMLGDALVYGVSLYALSRGDLWKARAAIFKGVFILLLGVGVLAQVGMKVLTGAPPISSIMIWAGFAALAVNLTCLALLWRFRRQDVNMSSTFECSRNDVMANIGVLVAAGAVMTTNSIWPDVIVSLIITAIFARSAFSVLVGAFPLLKTPQHT